MHPKKIQPDDNKDGMPEVGEQEASGLDSEKIDKSAKVKIGANALGQVKQELETMTHKWQLAVADYQNLEKRMEKDKEEWIKFGNSALLKQIIEIADDLERAALYVKDQGLDMVRNKLAGLLREFGVVEVDVLGKKFDHQEMEAVDKKTGKKDKVIELVLKGYKLHDKVLRPAKVVVGTG